MERLELVSFLLRIGIAFTLVYAGISIFLNPESWIGFIPQFIRDIGNAQFSLYTHGIFDIVLGVWLLINWKQFLASLITSLNLFFITILNLGAIEIVFRDVGLLLAAIALAVLSYKK